MKRRFEKFVAIIATFTMTTGMTSIMTTMAAETSKPEDNLAVLMEELRDSSEEQKEYSEVLDFNGDGIINVADAVFLEKQIAIDITDNTDKKDDVSADDQNSTDNEKMVEVIDRNYPGYFQSPYNFENYKFYKIYRIKEGQDVTEVSGAKPAIGVVCYRLSETDTPNYIQTFDFLESRDAMITGILMYNDKEYSYGVGYPYQNGCGSLYIKDHILRIIVHLEEEDGWDVAKYDYNKNNKIDIGDLVIFKKYFYNTPWKWVTDGKYEYGVNDDWEHLSYNEFFRELAYKEDWNEVGDDDGGYYFYK